MRKTNAPISNLCGGAILCPLIQHPANPELGCCFARVDVAGVLRDDCVADALFAYQGEGRPAWIGHKRKKRLVHAFTLTAKSVTELGSR